MVQANSWCSGMRGCELQNGRRQLQLWDAGGAGSDDGGGGGSSHRLLGSTGPFHPPGTNCHWETLNSHRDAFVLDRAVRFHPPSLYTHLPRAPTALALGRGSALTLRAVPLQLQMHSQQLPPAVSHRAGPPVGATAVQLPELHRAANRNREVLPVRPPRIFPRAWPTAGPDSLNLDRLSPTVWDIVSVSASCSLPASRCVFQWQVSAGGR